MCGISGIVSFGRSEFNSVDLTAQMNQRIRHRGPDDEGLIAFSGEELGLFGSKYFTEHPTIDLKSVDYMINMDMLGRLKPDEPVLIINGTGTSSAWHNVIDTSGTMSLHIKTNESGIGPSDLPCRQNWPRRNSARPSLRARSESL